MQNNKKTDLFRFVTMRSPEVISDARIDLGFITHPDEANSHFLVDLIGETDIAAGRLALSGKAGTYTTNNSPQDVKELDSTFWQFSDWLVKNKGNLTRISVDANIATVPSAANILEIWDDMLFDVLTKNNPNIRETCLQLIIAINFAQKYTSYSVFGETDEDILAQEAKDLKRLAEGKVILHQSFTTEKDTSYAPASFGLSTNYRRHEALHQARIAAVCANKLKAVKNELETLKITYHDDFKAAESSALATYHTQVSQAVDNYVAANPSEVAAAKIDVEKSLKSIDVSNLNTREIVKTLTQAETDLELVLPHDLADQFSFDYNAPLSAQYAQSKLSKAAYNYVETNLLEKASVDSALKILNKTIGNCEKAAYTIFKKKPKELLVNGVPIKTNNLGLRDFSISFNEVISEVDGSKSYSVYFSMETGIENGYIRSGTFTLKIDANTYITTDFNLLSNVSESIFGELYTDASITSLPENIVLEFDATFELNNGKTYTIDAEGLTSNTNISGSAVPNKSNITNPDLHYGVNTIGVADYRRVEQELCCYVPGEVARIENVLAREYKEKSTRVFTRNQFSSSTENEIESEKSIDTTENSRNEMSTELAEVIDEEKSKNYGFNASTTGKFGDITASAGASADFSLGKSTSDSNSTARTFAEDLTRRALERITQKISSKRSSKLIREYEEKNSHGFDNRAGDKHVTGVYRWIDKIYKNRIVNYGKRLIYEFMIPEPSRFYKEALIIKAEENIPIPLAASDNKEDVLIKPLHPSEIEIATAESLDRNNYTMAAAEYGIEVTAPPEAFSNVSISIGEGIGTNDAYHSYGYDTLNVDSDYECIRVKGELNASYESYSTDKNFIKCAVGGFTFTKSFGQGGGVKAVLEINQPVDDLEGNIPVTVSCRRVTAFSGSLVAVCELKIAAYEKWQQEVYEQIMTAYNTQMQAYKYAEQLAKDEEERANNLRQQIEAKNAEEEKLVTNSTFNAQRVRTELKRLCIEMLTKPFGLDMGKDFYQNGSHDIPEIKLGSTLDTYSNLVKFFEQAFDWDIMAQKFYPYYWADKSDWKSLFQTQDGLDYSYQAFLQSGMGRIVVPVREGFEDAVAYFMETGEVWNGSGIVIDTTDKLYLSIVDETTHVEGTVEGEEWETVVPTTLKVVQSKSVLLDEEGLPCCEDDPNATLLADTNILNAEPAEPEA